MKKQSGIRLSDEGSQLLEKLAAFYGVSKSSVLEILIREKARREGLDGQKGEAKE